MRTRNMDHQRRSTTDGSGGVTWGLRQDDGGAGLKRHRAEDYRDRRDLSEGASHGFQPAGKGKQLATSSQTARHV